MRRHGTIIKTILLIIVMIAVSSVIFAITFLRQNEEGGMTEQPSNNGTTENEATNDETVDRETRLAEINEILTDEYMILVNVDNGLNRDDAPASTTTIDGYTMESTAAAQLRKMLDDAETAGYTLTIYSAYRSYTKQETNFNNKINQYLAQGNDRETAEIKAANIVNPPGKSEHQTGLAADICTAALVYQYGSLPEQFSDTDAYTWLYEHCAEYGFILRYPEDKEDVTGITFEPWHYRYVGLERAKEIMDAKVCLEEFVADIKTEKAALEQE